MTVGGGGAGGWGEKGGGCGDRTRPQSAYVQKNLWVDGEGEGGEGGLSRSGVEVGVRPPGTDWGDLLVLQGEHVRNTLGTQGGLLGLQGEGGGAVVATVQLQVCSPQKTQQPPLCS